MRLFFLLLTIIGTSMAGIGIVVVLTMGMDGWQPIVVSAAVGAVLAMPVSWVVAGKIRHLQ